MSKPLLANNNFKQQSRLKPALSWEYLAKIPGRMRLQVNLLRGKPIQCDRITRSLSGINGIKACTVNHYTGKILIVYDEMKTSSRSIEHELEKLLDNHKKGASSGTSGSNIIKASFKFNRVLTPDEFKNSRNVLSKEYVNYHQKNTKSLIPCTPNKTNWHTLTLEETVDRLSADCLRGLSGEMAEQRMNQYGLNVFRKKAKKSILSLLLSQFDGFIIKLLLGASGISFLLGQVVDAITILFIIGVEAAIGAWQAYSAEKSLDLLKNLSTPNATVLRDGIRTDIPVSRLVPGDVLFLEAGDMVPADARLIESNSLQTMESSLTGETYPVYKKCCNIPYGDVPLGDRSNMVYMGTSIVKGNGRALVVATGMETEMGLIAGMLESSENTRTPLQKDLDRLAKFITWGCLGICALTVLGGIIGGNPVMNMFSTGVSLAVGAIPEGLTTVLAISLAFGAKRMARKNAIVKSLPSMETLSCTKVICTDKTGTLTKNEMTVKGIYTHQKDMMVTGEGYNVTGSIHFGQESISAENHEDLKLLLTACALCNNAELIPAKGSEYAIKGDPTEAALLILLKKSGYSPEDFDCYKREHEIPFDADSKKMTAVCSNQKGEVYAFVKGAVETVLPTCTHIQSGNGIESMTAEAIEQIQKSHEAMAHQAWRILALAYKPLPKGTKCKEAVDADNDLIFLGLVGIMDPPRPEVRQAIRKCHAAGIKVVMITGDHRNTAEAIAKSIDLLTPQGIILTSEDVERMGEDKLLEVVDRVEVFARSCPEQKLKIVKAFKKKGYVVAMTGDGVNDAPALKEAHIGIAMGQTGTDVAKDAASIILTDDNFNTVVKAVEEGRTVNRNIKKFMKYVLSGNLAEVLAIFAAAISGMPTPLIPAQILLLNLVTEGIPALSLGVDPPEKNIMDEPPRDGNKSVFDGKMMRRILGRGILTGLTTLGVFSGSLLLGGSLVKARTMAFANLVSCQMLHAFECSSLGIKRNKYLLPSVIISTGIMLATIYLSPFAHIFGMAALGLFDWMLIFISTLFLSRMNDFFKDLLYVVRIRKQPSFGV